MTGGEISNNISNSIGGGVSIYSAEFTMGGDAKIVKNKTVIGGGGVRIDGGTISISGNAMIAGNEARDFGGGLHVHRCYSTQEPAVLTMIDGLISGNSARYGGGLHVDEAEFVMSGGTVKGNTATEGGGGGLFIGKKVWQP